MGFCSCTIKFLLFVFNLICALVGLAIISLAVYAYSKGHTYKDFLSGNITASLIVLMVVGGVTFFIAFLGCCGAVREDPCYITTYGVLLSAILVIQLAIGGALFYFKGSLQQEMDKVLTLEYDGYDKIPAYRESIDALQKGLECCGEDGPDAWYSRSTLPPSCCRNTADTCIRQEAYQRGCKRTLTELIKTSLSSIGTVAFIVAALEFFCVICAFCVASSIRREQHNGYAY